MKKSLIMVPVLALLTACGTTTMVSVPNENINKREVPNWYLEHADVGSESKAWYKPWDKEGMYYAVAEDVSPSMEMAVKKATLKAKAKVADRVTGELNARTTIKYDEKGAPERPQGYGQAQDLIVNLISENVLRTYSVSQKSVVYSPEFGTYRAFVLIKINQKDVQALAAAYDNKKAVKLNGRVAGESLEEASTKLLKQTQQ